MPAATAARSRSSSNAAPDVDTAAALARFPFRFEIVPVSLMFVDKDYQRDLTSFLERIESAFNPALILTLALSQRSSGKYAIIDGQTRMVACERLGLAALPACVFMGLSKADEAEIFYLIGTERRNLTSWDRFKAALAAKRPEALAIKKLVESVGMQVGPDIKKGQISAVAALREGYQTSEWNLERSLVNLQAAWPEKTPDGQMIRGMFSFFQNAAAKIDVDDERLTRRLKTTNIAELKIKAAHKRAGSARGGMAGGGRSMSFYIGQAILDAYRTG